MTARGVTGADADALLFVSALGRPLDCSHWRRRVWLPAWAAAGLVGLGFMTCVERTPPGWWQTMSTSGRPSLVSAIQTRA